MRFTSQQLDKLADLFLDLAKGLFLAALAVPAFSPQATLFTSLKGIIAGLIFTYLSLKAIELKEVT